MWACDYVSSYSLRFVYHFSFSFNQLFLCNHFIVSTLIAVDPLFYFFLDKSFKHFCSYRISRWEIYGESFNEKKNYSLSKCKFNRPWNFVKSSRRLFELIPLLLNVPSLYLYLSGISFNSITNFCSHAMKLSSSRLAKVNKIFQLRYQCFTQYKYWLNRIHENRIELLKLYDPSMFTALIIYESIFAIWIS